MNVPIILRIGLGSQGSNLAAGCANNWAGIFRRLQNKDAQTVMELRRNLLHGGVNTDHPRLRAAAASAMNFRPFYLGPENMEGAENDKQIPEFWKEIQDEVLEYALEADIIEAMLAGGGITGRNLAALFLSQLKERAKKIGKGIRLFATIIRPSLKDDFVDEDRIEQSDKMIEEVRSLGVICNEYCIDAAYNMNMNLEDAFNQFKMRVMHGSDALTVTTFTNFGDRVDGGKLKGLFDTSKGTRLTNIAYREIPVSAIKALEIADKKDRAEKNLRQLYHEIASENLGFSTAEKPVEGCIRVIRGGTEASALMELFKKFDKASANPIKPISLREDGIDPKVVTVTLASIREPLGTAATASPEPHLTLVKNHEKGNGHAAKAEHPPASPQPGPPQIVPSHASLNFARLADLEGRLKKNDPDAWDFLKTGRLTCAVIGEEVAKFVLSVGQPLEKAEVSPAILSLFRSSLLEGGIAALPGVKPAEQLRIKSFLYSPRQAEMKSA